MLVVDFIVSHGPLRRYVLRAFGQQSHSREEQRRFLSQLAAKLVGMIFLASIMPLAFEALSNPALRTGRRFLSRTDTSQRMTEVGAGYFLYDVVLCLTKFDDNGLEFLIHAIVCCTVFCAACGAGVMHYFGACFLLWELSTPFMYIRWLMLKAGLAKSRGMMVANLAFMLSFFLCRNVWGPVMTLDFWRESAAELARAQPALPVRVIWGTRAMALCLNTLNAYWFSQMVLIATRGGKPKQKAV
ncbi:DUF887-domain-containing [Micractinium conductrix]|uniref:DUF887-domain-containing n=1 Tax=Micractinium conductrix TaxID=554055 RepID=A0A2P6V0R1_9CHLO|nr:DUF887-domain-containing [Micractinium conductrix]|eukprot:PSC67686.1 DUF887-domain-containing [Micractinium conductrix]